MWYINFIVMFLCLLFRQEDMIFSLNVNSRKLIVNFYLVDN